MTYALAGVDNPETGWGRRDETWSFMAALAEIGGETWFKLGDRDLALHVERTRRLRAGETLSAVTADVARRLGIASRILPMSDDRVRTMVRARDGLIEFQRYFVERQCVPQVTGFVVRRRGAGERPSGDSGDTAQPASARGRDLPVESVHQH